MSANKSGSALIALVSGLLAACGSSSNADSTVAQGDTAPDGAAPDGAAAGVGLTGVMLWPSDGTSNFRDQPFVRMSFAGIDLTEARIASIRSRIKLMDAAKSAVTFSLRETKASDGSEVTLYVNPTAPLGAGTFTVRVEPLPDGFQWTRSTIARFGTDGAAETTFTTSSAGRLTRIEACEKPGGVSILTLVFSEKIASPPNDSVDLRYSDGAATGCVFSASQAASTHYGASCTSLDVNRTLSVKLKTGLTTEAGTPVEPGEYNLLLSSAVLVGDGCRQVNY